jgi:dipeptidyl aminopeptidase/acylaminoacyl peptidase
VLTHTRLSDLGPSDGTESDSYGDRWYMGQLWRHFESAWRQSPLAHAQHAKTPFMLLQDQSDTTDPEGQSKEMYRALRQEGASTATSLSA